MGDGYEERIEELEAEVEEAWEKKSKETQQGLLLHLKLAQVREWVESNAPTTRFPPWDKLDSILAGDDEPPLAVVEGALIPGEVEAFQSGEEDSFVIWGPRSKHSLDIPVTVAVWRRKEKK